MSIVIFTRIHDERTPSLRYSRYKTDTIQTQDETNMDDSNTKVVPNLLLDLTSKIRSILMVETKRQTRSYTSKATQRHTRVRKHRFVHSERICSFNKVIKMKFHIRESLYFFLILVFFVTGSKITETILEKRSQNRTSVSNEVNNSSASSQSLPMIEDRERENTSSGMRNRQFPPSDRLERKRRRTASTPSISEETLNSLTQIKDFVEKIDKENSESITVYDDPTDKLTIEQQEELIQIILTYNMEANQKRVRKFDFGQQLNDFITETKTTDYNNFKHMFDKAMSLSMLTEVPTAVKPQTRSPTYLSPTYLPTSEVTTVVTPSPSDFPTPRSSTVLPTSPNTVSIHPTHTVSIHPTREDEQSKPEPTQEGVSSDKPTLRTTFTVSPTTVESRCESLSTADALLERLSVLTDTSLLEDSVSPQGMAYLWLLDEDSRQLDPCAVNQLPLLQRYALAVFYYSTSGDSWKSSKGWLSGSPDCEWEFVTCHQDKNRTGLVSALRLAKNHLIGTIPSEIEGLGQIEILELFDNSLDGKIPKTVSSLSVLTTFDVEENKLDGNPFSVFASSNNSNTNLQRLRLSSNQFAGSISSEMLSFPKLKELWLSTNDFGGTIPSEIGELTLLESVLMYDNRFTGSVPTSIGKLRLKEFLVHSNKLSGTIPSELFDNIDLTILRLDENAFNGTISTNIGDLMDLKDFRVNNNKLTGQLPITLWALNKLEFLSVSFNNFDGRLRDNFNFFSSLDYVDFSQNSFTGAIPSSLFAIPTIRLVYLNSNKLQGPIPDNYGAPPILRDLYIYDNLLDGSIPTIEQGQLTNLQEFLMQGNDLTGIMPASICALRAPLGNGILENLWADCDSVDGQPPEVECECCTQCVFVTKEKS